MMVRNKIIERLTYAGQIALERETRELFVVLNNVMRLVCTNYNMDLYGTARKFKKNHEKKMNRKRCWYARCHATSALHQ